MSENNIYYPEKLTGEELDAFLEMGWYRMGQTVFTAQFLELKDYAHRVFWLRYNLKNLALSKSQRRLKAGNNQFDVSIKPLEITDEIEDLYADYKTSIKFQASPSVYYWLYGEETNYNIFNSELIEVRDKNKLIAVGIADSGAESIAGIINFYHPDYKKHSLGKYLMLLKIEQAQRKNLQWYYPGYIVYQKPEFDYKLLFDNNAIEILIPELNGWQAFQNQFIEEYGAVI